ncbi:MAG: sugar ABC transporter permease [Deinococcota bacterium]
MKERNSEAVAAYMFLLPFLLVFGIFFVYATVRAIYFSFTDYDLFNPPTWVGFRNYANLFREENFRIALRNSVLFSLVVTAVQTFLALVTAAALNTNIRGLNIFRTAYYIPSVTSSAAITLIFIWLFQRRGLFNYLATQFQQFLPHIIIFLIILGVMQLAQVLWEQRRGFPAKWYDPALFVVAFLVAAVGIWVLNALGFVSPRDVDAVDFVWLQTRQEVGIGFWGSLPVPLIAIMIQNIFTTVPTFMLMFLAALQDVPKSYYEAASLDGANATQQFFQITIPSVQPVTFLVVTLGLIGTLQMFDQVAIFGDAAPLRSMITLAFFVYWRMFPGAQTPEVGFAAASAMFLAVFTLLIVLLQRRFIRSEGY